jgi:surface carbohydrate biosynthesis protein
MQAIQKILIFPVETVVRELDFRLILAVLCARPNCQILIGDHEHLFPISLRLKSAVLVVKNVTGGKHPWKYRRYKELGHRIIHLDEEGAIYYGGKDAWRASLDKRLDIRQLAAEDYVCTWGRFQANHYRERNAACHDNIIATGHPRLNLGTPKFRNLFEQEVDELRAKHGDFILINTNLASNNAFGPDVYLRHNNVQPEDVPARTYRMQQYAHEAQREALFIRLINHLSNSFPGNQIILRPHPSEDIRKYKTLLSYIPRVVVTRDGSLHAWLLAARVLIHGGCTTAIEAHVCGTPIINFRPLQDSRFEIPLPNLIGASCVSEEEVATVIQNVMAGHSTPALANANYETLSEMLANVESNTDSFEAIAEIIAKCQDETTSSKMTYMKPLLSLRRIKDFLGGVTRSSRYLRRFFHSHNRGLDKFPPFDRKKIARKVELIEKITEKSVTLRFHSSKILSITAGQNPGPKALIQPEN